MDDKTAIAPLECADSERVPDTCLVAEPAPQQPILRVHISAAYQGVEVLHDFALSIGPGEVVGLVGESGSGKSTVAMAILRLLEYRGGRSRGEIWFRKRNLMALSEREMRSLRGREIALVMQSPQAALNPAMKIGRQILECWRAHHPAKGEPAPDLRQLLDIVHLPHGEELLDRYPREISVGQAQRVLIAMAILHRPSLIVADEPTSALDSVTQAEILKLLADLNRRLGMGILYISHDLLSVATLCHRIVVLRQGCAVETGSVEQIFRKPRHPYTRALVDSIPVRPV